MEKIVGLGIRVGFCRGVGEENGGGLIYTVPWARKMG